MNSQRRAPHVPRTKCTWTLFARAQSPLARKKISSSLDKKRMRDREMREMRETKKKQERKKGKKHSYLRGSALNLRCDGVVHRAAPSILFPPVDLWRTMHYVNCKRAAGDRGKSNNSELRRVGITLRQSERHAAGWLAATDRTAAMLDLEDNVWTGVVG